MLKIIKKRENYIDDIGQVGRISWAVEKAITSQNYISSWAYRWMFTLWKHQVYSVSPNIKLIKYNGHSEGAHVRTKQRWKEIDPEFESQFNIMDSLVMIPEVEQWT